jgi:hypothetical protein
MMKLKKKTLIERKSKKKRKKIAKHCYSNE